VALLRDSNCASVSFESTLVGVAILAVTGGVVGRGVIPMDFGPHCLFRGDVSDPSREPEQGGKVLMRVP